jgi:hypothetical protein
MPHIPSFIPGCVMFIGAPSDCIGKPRDALTGTCFVLLRKSPRVDVAHMYVLTARHVINDTAELTGGTVFIRANTNLATAAWAETQKTHWITGDSNIDVAVLPLALNPVAVSFHCIPGHCLATKEALKANKRTVEIGDELVIPGLFVHRKGEQRNIPIVRMGTIAAQAEEPIYAEMAENDIQKIDAYLVEIRSIGGLSGSPVLIHRYEKNEEGEQTSVWALLGLMHGHYEDPFPMTVPQSKQYLNAGIGVVVPADDIAKVLSLPEIIEIEKNAETQNVTDVGGLQWKPT